MLMLVMKENGETVNASQTNLEKSHFGGRPYTDNHDRGNELGI